MNFPFRALFFILILCFPFPFNWFNPPTFFPFLSYSLLSSTLFVTFHLSFLFSVFFHSHYLFALSLSITCATGRSPHNQTAGQWIHTNCKPVLRLMMFIISTYDDLRFRHCSTDNSSIKSYHLVSYLLSLSLSIYLSVFLFFSLSLSLSLSLHLSLFLSLSLSLPLYLSYSSLSLTQTDGQNHVSRKLP